MTFLVSTMKTRSRTLDENLSKQKRDERGIGYVDVASTSNSKDNTIFIKGPIHVENTAIVPTFTHVNPVPSALKGKVIQAKFMLVYYHCGVKGHIRPFC